MKLKLKTFFILILLVFVQACSNNLVEGENALDKVSVAIVQGDGQFVFANTDFVEPLKIKITGPSSDLSGIPVRFELVNGSAAASLSKDFVYTDSDGFAKVNAQAGFESGTISIKASLPQANTDDNSVIFNAYVQGASVAWQIINSGGATETAGTSFTVSVKALLLDDSVDTEVNGMRFLQFSTNNPDSPNGTSAVLPPDGLYNIVNGVVTPDPTLTLYNSSENGADTFTVSVIGGGITGTTNPFQINDGAYGGLSIRDADSCAGNVVEDRFSTALAPVTLYAYSTDAYGNCTTSASGNWSKTFTNPELVFDTATSGVHQVQYTPWIVSATGSISVNDGTYTANTGTITVSDATPDHFAIMGIDVASNFTTIAGDTHDIIVRAEDIANNATNLYDGNHALTWETTATNNSPPIEISAPLSPSIPSNTTYTFSAGYITSPTPQIVLYNTLETPTVTVYDNGSCAGNMCGTSNALNINTNTKSEALVRTAALNGGSVFNASSILTTADDSYNLFCATYDSYGNFIEDDAGADWLVTGDIVAGDIAPDLVDESNITYNAKLVGSGTIACDVDGTVDGLGIADSTDLFTITPGVPNYFKLDGGTGNDNAFSTTAGVAFSVDVKTYDADNNFCSNYNNASFSATVSYQGSTAVFPAVPADITPTFSSPKIDNTDTISKSYNLNFSAGTATISNLLLINDTENADEPKLRVEDNGAIVTMAETGDITVNENVLFDISLRDGANNTGSRVDAPTITTDDTLTLYAAGYDLTGNYIGDQNVDWTNTAPSGNCVIGEVAGNPAPLTSTQSVIFSPNDTGSCTLTAVHAGSSSSDTTGLITLNNGVVDYFAVEIQGGVTNVTAGDPFNIIVTAYDQDDNVVVDYTPDTTYSLTTTSPAAPEGQTPTSFTLLPGDFSAGVATVTGAAVYLAGTDFTITATETGSGSITGTSVSISVDPNTLHHYATSNMTGPFIADGTSTFSVDIEARDEWGNLTTTGIGALIDLTAVRLSDEANVTTFGGPATGIDLAGSSTITVSGLTYLVSHEIALVAEDTNTVSTPAAQRDAATFAADINSLANYTIENFSTTTPTAGVAFTAQVLVKDIAGNTITGLDGILTGYGSYSTNSGANDSPYTDAPSHPSGTFTFTNGVSNNISYTFNNTETVAISSFTVDDGNGVTGTGGAGNITVGGAPLHHYATTAATGPFVADGSSTFSLTIQAKDEFGNLTTNGIGALIDLTAVRLSDETNVATFGGSATGIDLAGASSITLNDLTYLVSHEVSFIAQDTNTISTPVAQRDSATFSAAAETVANYVIDTFSTTTPDAGASFTARINAKDIAGNTITGLDTTLSGYSFTTNSAAVDSPYSNSPSYPSGTYTFTNGVSSNFTYTLYNAETVAISSFTCNDGNGDTGTGGAGNIVVAGTTLDHYATTNATGPFIADGSSTFSVDIEARDQYGNLTTNGIGALIDLTPLRLSGETTVTSIGGGASGIDLGGSSSITVSGLTYLVSHEIAFLAEDTDTVTTPVSRRDSADFSASADTIANYVIDTFSTTTPTAGVAFTAKITAKDVEGNTITGLDGVLSGYNFTTNSAANDSDYSDSPSYPSGTFTFTNGESNNISYTFYKEETVAISSFTCNDGNGKTCTSGSGNITVDENTLHHYATTTATGPFIADGSSTFSVNIEARDQYGNLTTTGIGALIDLTAVRLSDETNVTTFGGTATSIDLAGSDTITISNLTYLVSHKISFVAQDTNTVTTPVAQRDSATFTPHINSLSSYDIDSFSTNTPTAGTAFTARVYAKDVAGNTITGIDGILNGYGTFSTGSAATNSYYGNTPSYPSGSFSFTNGESTNISYTLYNTQTITKSSFTVDDGNGITGTGLTGNITVGGDSLDHYANESVDTNIDADGIDTITANLFARDQWGNTVAGDASIGLAENQLDANNPGLLGGTVSGIDMSSGTQTISDLTYNVFGTMELVTTGGSVSMDSSRSVDYTMDIVIGTLHHYDLDFTGNATAGIPYSIQVDLKDYGDNTIPTLEAIVNARNFQWSAGLNDSPEGDATTPNESTNYSLTFNASGVATTNVTFVNAETLAIGDLDITDDAATPIRGTSEASLIIDPDVADHIVFLGATTGTADDTTTYSLTIESRDQFGNTNATGNASDNNLTVEPIRTAGLTNVGPFGGTITGIDLQNNATQTVGDLTYQVPHTMKFGFDTVPSISIDDTLSTEVTWSVDQLSVNYYTLEPDSATTTAGAPTAFTLEAYDGGGNLITNGDGVLETINYTFTTSADCDAAYDPGAIYTAALNEPTDGTIDYTAGVASLSYKVFNADGTCGDAGDFSVVDNNTTGVSNTSAITTVNVSTSDHFIITSNNFPANADGTAQTATDVTIELQDLYGNPRTDTISGTLLSFAKQAGYGTNLGTLEACSPAANDGCAGGKQALSAINLDFNGTSTQTIYDLNYDVAHTIEIFATSGGVTTIAADTDNLKFDSVYGTIASYTFERPAATGVAGADQAWTITAYDAAGNALTGTENETMLENINFTISDLSGGQMNGPEAGTVSFLSATGLDFNQATGAATTNLQFYNTTNDVAQNWLQLSDDQTAITVNNDASNTMDITYAAADHFHVTVAGFTDSEVSDASTYGGTSATIYLQDQYGNAAQGLNSVSVAPVYVSGFGTNLGVLQAAQVDSGARSDITGMTLDFTSVSDITLYDFGYNVFQEIDIRAWQGGVDTDQAESANFNFDFHESNVASYVLDRTAATGTAGAATTWRLRAYDQANNLMTGADNKTELDSRTFTFTDLSTGDMNGPTSGTASVPAATPLTWNSGTAEATFDVTAYNKANGIALGYIEAQDDYTTPISVTNSNAMTIVGASGDHFHVTGTGFPMDSDGVQDTGTSITIELQDEYGNDTIDATVTNATIYLNRLSGYTSLGNLLVDTSDGAGSPVDITTLTPSFDVNETVTYYDISYDVGQTLEVLVSHASVTNNTQAAGTDDLVFNTVAGTVVSYDLTFNDTTVVAGATTQATLTAKDGGGNIINNDDATLNLINFNFTVQNGSFNAPGTADTVAANGPTNGTLTFTGGQATLDYKFFATGTVGTNYVRVTDTTNTIGPQGNQDTIDVTPAAGSYFQFQNPAESIIGTPSTVTLEVYDLYGNLHNTWGTDVKLVVDGSATMDPVSEVIDIVAGVGTIDVNDAVAETVNLSIDDYLTTGLTLDTEDIIFTGPPHTIVFLTQPVANETRSKTFDTTPQIEVRDSAGTRVWADDSTVVTLQPFTNIGCSVAGSGTLNNASGTVTAGRLTFPTLNYNGAEQIYIGTSAAVTTEGCSNATTVYETLSIDNPPGGNHQQGVMYTYEITGGVPPLSIAASTFNSGGTSGGVYSGGGCPVGKYCVDYTPGTTVGVTDTLNVTDSGAVTNNDSASTFVDGAILSNTGDSESYGSTALDQSNTFTIYNGGNINSGALSVSFTPVDASYWSVTPDLCNTNSLAAAASCDITVTFLGGTGNSGSPVNGTQNATLTITGGSNGDITLNLTADRDGAIFNNTGDSGAYGLTALDDQQTFTIQNTGNANSGVITSTFTPSDAAYWSVDSDNCDTNTLNAAASCTIAITFLGETGNSGNPVNGAQTATLTIEGASGGAETINLTATRDGAILTSVGDAPTYPSTTTDDQRTFTIENTGNGTTGVLTTTFTPANPLYWNIDTDGCNSSTLAVNGNQCDIQITFLGASGNASSPAPGVYNATLTVEGGTAGTRTLNLQGTIP